MPVRIAELNQDAVGLAELVRNGEIQAEELVESVIESIERTHGDLNAVVTPMFDVARAEAKRAGEDGPFAGVPFLLKDLRASYAGVATSEGNALLRDTSATYDSEIVVRHKRAGLICVGKTNSPEFGLTATTEPHAFGPTRNPWDLRRTPGGSSGGAAAAVAARIVPMAHASDGGGSIRIPASCCGLVGLKPTRGRNPLGPDCGDVMNGLVAEHALTISVRDSAALLDATAGPDVGDPYWAPPPRRPFLDEVGENPGTLRIAFSAESPMGTSVERDCVDAVESTAKLLEDLGHRVEADAPDYDDPPFRVAFTTVWFSNLAANIATLSAALGRDASADCFEPFTWALGQRGATLSGADYVQAIGELQSLSRKIARFFRQYDVWMTPTLAAAPPELGFLHPGPKEADLRPYGKRVREFVPFTQIANATGQPAVSLPLHWSADGLPIGVQFAAAFGDEATLFRLASQLEDARPWRQRRPPICSWPRKPRLDDGIGTLRRDERGLQLVSTLGSR